MGRERRVSQQLDELATTLIGECLDVLAEGEELGVVASVVDANSNRLTFGSTAEPLGEALSWAHDWVVGLAAGTIDREALSDPVAYAICYVGAVDVAPEPSSKNADSFADSSLGGSFGLQDALICEFGEKGAQTAWSSYQLVRGIGQGVKFSYTDPLPAGETELLL